ncbi:MAG: hypothetical protein WKF64_00740 [Ilumatobacteraceae bacterium]
MSTSTLSTETARSWLAGRLPQDWFDGEPTITIDRDEILVVGALSDPKLADDASDADRAAARDGRASQFREDTRSRRMEIANELEHATGRKVAWGVELGDERKVFTSLAAPVMTRLRQTERQVLDTLVDAGVARSRSDALGWCVRLVGQHSHDWLDELRRALEQVEQVRTTGPDT